MFLSQKDYVESVISGLFVNEQSPNQNPNDFSSFSDEEMGYIRFDPFPIQKKTSQSIQFSSITEDDYYQSVNKFYDGISWTQEDFYSTIKPLSKYVWGKSENLSDWQIYHVMYEGICQDNIKGFQGMNITLYRVENRGFMEKYIVRKITIDPISGVAQWAGDKVFSRIFIFGWNGFDTEIINLTADQALLAAEENGGVNARTSDRNKCEVYVYLSGNGNKNDTFWIVDYDFGLFLARINAYSGKIQVASHKE